MNNISAIFNGNFANNDSFYGSGTAEVVARAVDNVGGWNGNQPRSITSGSPWTMRSGNSNNSVLSSIGIMSFSYNPGGIRQDISHRTILLGY